MYDDGKVHIVELSDLISTIFLWPVGFYPLFTYSPKMAFQIPISFPRLHLYLKLYVPLIQCRRFLYIYALKDFIAVSSRPNMTFEFSTTNFNDLTQYASTRCVSVAVFNSYVIYISIEESKKRFPFVGTNRIPALISHSILVWAVDGYWLLAIDIIYGASKIVVMWRKPWSWFIDNVAQDPYRVSRIFH